MIALDSPGTACQKLLPALLLALLVGCRQPEPAALPPPPPTPLGALQAPDGSALPDGEMGRSILRGHAILAATRDSLPDNVGNHLRCLSCHLDDGRRAGAIPFTGVYARFPQFRSRSASISRLEDRINDCFERSMVGTALAWDDPAMRDIVAYFAFISRGVRVGDKVPGQGLQLGEETHGDTVAGAAIFASTCARCHGADGEGTGIAPATWGPNSFGIAAGMARIRTAASFILHNMPYDRAVTLTDAQALNVAAYVVSRPRPDFVGKQNDWPRGDPPPDVAYPTTAGRRAAKP
ncbi:MAG: c-type cytochrome [Gemmatimonadota bacterium]